jgi:uncharacterized protein (DUF58 family)
MIYPTRLSILAALAGAPIALLLGLVQPGLWLAAPAWLMGLGVLMLIDALFAAAPRSVGITFEPPGYLAVAAPATALLQGDFSRGGTRRRLEIALDAEARTGLDSAVGRTDPARRDAVLFDMTPVRRGLAVFTQATLRWQGPLGLIWRQTRRPLNEAIPIGADVRRIEDEAVRFVSRDALHGAKAQIDIGEGAEFHALRDFHSGMDRRTIDWKQSARHHHLLAKEFRVERNHQIIMALDCGRVMSEPVGGAPRIDRAIHGALILAYACLREGDRAGLFAFAERPKLTTGAVASVASFPLLVRQAATIDYGTTETNYALGLTTLSASLKRRSMVVVFTEFADTTAAELMIETVSRLIKRHLVLFVVMRDEELETLVSTVPETPEDVSRAVVAASLLRERDLVLARLRRLGAHIVEAEAQHVGPAILNAYLDLKRRDLL